MPFEVVTAVRELTLTELRRQKPIPSGFRTQSILRLDQRHEGSSIEWRLRELALPNTLVKNYDSGEVDEILSAYGEHVDARTLHFLGAFHDRDIQGLAIWRDEGWNSTVWLLDIRVREKSRGHGIGSELLRHLQDLVTEKRLRGILVETQSNNARAIQFYRRQGFRICGFNDHLYTNSDADSGDVALYFFWEAEV